MAGVTIKCPNCERDVELVELEDKGDETIFTEGCECGAELTLTMVLGDDDD